MAQSIQRLDLDNQQLILNEDNELTISKGNTIQLPLVTSIADLQSFPNNIALFDGNTWEKKTGNVQSNGGEFPGTLIRVNSTTYWERKTNDGFIIPSYFGAIGDGITDDTNALQNSFIASLNINLNGLTYLFNGSFISNTNFQLKNGVIKFLNNSNLIRFGQNSRISNVKFIGTLVSSQMYLEDFNGVTSYFSTPTYQDNNTNVIDGSDFTKSVVGNILSINLPSSLTATLSRFVVSSAITLDNTKKYVIKIDDNSITGNGYLGIQFWKCNSSGAELSEYIPNSTGTWLYLDTCEKLKIKIGASRHDHTKLNLTCTFDLSKIHIYEVVNEFSNFANNYNPEDGTNISIYSDDVIVENCEFENMLYASLKIVGGNRNKITNCKIKNSIGGFTTQNGSYNIFDNNKIDLRFKDSNSNLLDSGMFTRNHGIGIGYNERFTEVSNNIIIGASWAIENPEGITISQDITLKDNTIKATHCGISICATRGITKNNKIYISSLSLYGIELPTADYAICSNNTIISEIPAVLNYGIAGSKGLLEASINNNVVEGNVGMQFVITVSNSDKRFTIQNNKIKFYTTGVYSSVGGTSVINNILSCYNRFSGKPLSPSISLQMETNFYTNRCIGNNIDGAGSYCYYVSNPQTFEVIDNKFNSFTGNYVDVYATVTNSYQSFGKIINNDIQNKSSQSFAITGTLNALSRWQFFNNSYSTPNNGSTLVNIPTGLTTANLFVNTTIQQFTTTNRDLLLFPYAGLEIYNITTNAKEIYNGSTWINNDSKYVAQTGTTTLSGSIINNNTTNNLGSASFPFLTNYTTTFLAPIGNGATPPYSFVGATGDGMWSVSSGQLGFSTGGGQRLQLNSTTIYNPQTASGFLIKFQSASGTSPTYVVNRADANTGIGASSSGNITFITAGTNKMDLMNSGSLLLGTTTELPSSLLTIQSTSKGILIPRMTTAQKNAISSPATGLQIYDTDLNKLCIYNGTFWGTVDTIAGSYSGIGTATTTFTITIGTIMPNTTYKVNVTPTSMLAAAVFYVTNKTTTTFDVMYLTELTGTVAFDWSVFK